MFEQGTCDAFFKRCSGILLRLLFFVATSIGLQPIISSQSLQASDEFEVAPIYYSKTPAQTEIESLQRALDQREIEFPDSSPKDQIEFLLKQLRISPSSQVLVFSKTSLQINRIGPRTPRAIYFNDSIYVGYVPGSPTVEVTAIDDNIGAVFYTFELPPRRKTTSNIGNEPAGSNLERTTENKHNDAPKTTEFKPQFLRDKGQCLSCHATSRTERVPGLVVRSIFSDKAGRPRSNSSSFITDHQSPFHQRWGGWYVTGTHGDMRHMGNVLALDVDSPEKLDMDSGANWQSLDGKMNLRPYIEPTSDIVALMVLEHQAKVQNLITRANFETRQAIHLDETMNKALERPTTYRSETTQRRIKKVASDLVKALLFVDEFELTSSVHGSSAFTEFHQNSPHDSEALRSLKKLKLTNRLYQSPCSHLILSDQFDALPVEVKQLVVHEVSAILSGKISPPGKVLWDNSTTFDTLALLRAQRPEWFVEQ